MDVVEKTGNACRICYLNGKIDTSFPVPYLSCQLTSKLHYHTMLMKWLSSIKPRKLGRKSREDSLHPMWAQFFHSTHILKAELTIQCKTRQPQHTPYLGGNFSSCDAINSNQQTMLRVTWPGTWHERPWRVKGHHGHLRGRCNWHSTYDPFWLQTSSHFRTKLTLIIMHTSRQQHTPSFSTYICAHLENLRTFFEKSSQVFIYLEAKTLILLLPNLVHWS